MDKNKILLSLLILILSFTMISCGGNSREIVEYQPNTPGSNAPEMGEISSVWSVSCSN